MRAWVKNGGGQRTCQLYARAAGWSGTENIVNLPVSADWTQVQVNAVYVTDGQLELGLRSDANAGNYCSIDDVELVYIPLATTPAGVAAAAPQLFPNPTTGSLTISYTLNQPAVVTVALYALTGQLVRPLTTLPTAPAGAHRFTLGALEGLPAGVYLVQLSHDGYTSTQRVVKL